MKAKRVAVRQAAGRDIEAAVGHYLQEGGAALARRFVAALEEAYRHTRRFPATEREDQVDVLKVLHAQRDIPAWLTDGPDL